ncbi:MAG: class II aldolase/adducin family protein [Pirellulaceae bacterium]
MEYENEREQICEIGRRMYDRQFCSANEGNISMRLDEHQVLCTPTLHCKGFLKPKDLCVVDLDGNQICGEKRRTSEILLHLEIYRNRPDVDSVVHCHPPHATAFAITGEPIPMGVLPEPEVFLGEVPTAPYILPGTDQFAKTVTPFVMHTNAIVLSNHGVVSYDKGLERAYWLTEILDSYCRILINSRALGEINYFTGTQMRELLNLRVRWGFPDPRCDCPLTDEELSQHPTFRQHWPSKVAPKSFRNC